MMDKSISRGLHLTFLVHAIIAVVLGVLLWTIPGQGLSFLDWVPETLTVGDTDVSGPGTVLVDPILTRLLGATLLAMALSSFQGWRAEKWGRVELLVQFEAAYCILAVIGMLAALILDRPFNWIRWVTVGVLAAFAVAWSVAYWRHRSAQLALIGVPGGALGGLLGAAVGNRLFANCNAVWIGYIMGATGVGPVSAFVIFLVSFLIARCKIV